ncbi:MAG: hypothetical protein DMF94_21065 [Acidobacteria bacterium]|nr:MAG: hypothetical protein DMF94_21065 [Acidobacteriota bacterium]
MATERRRQMLLGAVAVVLALVLYRIWPSTSASSAPSSNGRGGATAERQQQAPAAPTAPDVHLGVLNGERPKPAARERDVFRFKSKPPPPPIGLMGLPSRDVKIAVLSDGVNLPFYGKEGEVVLGRYRILKIGVESIEIAYIDGRGRQTIRIQ